MNRFGVIAYIVFMIGLCFLLAYFLQNTPGHK